MDVVLTEVGEALCAVRLCPPEAQREMRQSLAKLGQLTPVQVYRDGGKLELIDGFKRLHAARAMSWPKLRAEVQQVDAAGAKVQLWRCNAGAGLSEIEEAWLVRALYRDDKLTQPQIGLLLVRHKSWVCRRLMLAESLTDAVTADVRLVVRLVDGLLGAPGEPERKELLEVAGTATAGGRTGGGARRRTPGEHLAADAFAMKRLSVRLHSRLLERSLASLGAEAAAIAARELVELKAALTALGTTLEHRLAEKESDARPE